MSAPTIRLSTPADLLAAVPHLLGFQPTDSLVLVTLHRVADASRVGMVARLDLPDEGEATAAVEALLPALQREDPTTALLVGYGTVTADVVTAVEVAAGVLAANGLQPMDRFTVIGDRWRSLDCTDIDCCPPTGTAMPGADAPAGLEIAVTTGSSPSPSRDAMAQRVAAGPRAPAVGRECARQSSTKGEVTVERGAAAWGRLLDVCDPLDLGVFSDGTLALATLSLHADDKPALRDALAAWLSPGTMALEQIAGPALDGLRVHLPLPWWQASIDHEVAASARRVLIDRLVELAACLPDQHAAPVLTLLAQVAWAQGSGALANVAISRALAAQPDYRLALLLDRMLTLGMRPPGL